MTDTEPPTFVPRGRVLTTQGGESRAAGRWGVSPERQGLSYASKRDSHTHRLRALDAYAISTDVLDQLNGLNVQNVFIIETDSGDVYEFGLDDFREWGDPVPEEFLDDPLDPQRYHERDDPRHHWPGHALEFVSYRDDTPDHIEFQSASELKGDT